MKPKTKAAHSSHPQPARPPTGSASHSGDGGSTPALLRPEEALFLGKITSFAVTLYENERPPQGLAGIFDWYCFGKISQSLKMGVLTGKLGECSYFPFTRKQQTFHFLFLGAGLNSQPGKRKNIPNDCLEKFSHNLSLLKLPKIGISKSDFGDLTDHDLTKYFKGVPMWITA